MQEHKENIVLDIDGTVLDFTKGFSKYYNEYPTKIYNKTIHENPHEWNFGLIGEESKEMLTIMTEYINSGPFLELLDNEWANLLNSIRDKYNIHVVTCYPNEKSRIENLLAHNISYDTIQFPSHDNKWNVIQKINPTFVIEDCPHHITRVLDVCTNATVLVPNRWNYVQHISHDRVIKYDAVIHLYDIL